MPVTPGKALRTFPGPTNFARMAAGFGPSCTRLPASEVPVPPLRIGLKRVYDSPAASDGRRVLVERLWPRGLTKERAAVDHWAKDLSPSPDLRAWYGHRPELWPEFRRRYRAELAAKGPALDELRRLCAQRRVTFVFAAKDEARNSAVVLKDFLETASSGRSD